ncbi:MAG: PD40 domain-containing protein [Alphaproteobacteria bacterium]|nr:PD40 domain-containing protein [Alphaproteobacteria bacterium]
MSRLSKIVAGTALAAGLTWSPKADAKFVFPYNHPDLDWYSIETEHFYVHYPVSKKSPEEGNEHYVNAEWSARKSAKVAEEMWAPMCAEFNYFLKEKVHIVILDQSDHLEGFTIPSWDWVEVSANAGGYFYRMRGRMEWFSDVLVHEFAHVVSLKANAPIGEGAGGVLLGGLYSDGIRDADTGVELMIGGGEPFWWTEGGAEYWSDNAGYNWWSSSRDMNIRTTVLEGRLLTYDEWVSRVDKRDWGDGERGYQQGYSIALYLRERFGDETFARFALEYGKGWRPNWETVIEDVLGIDAATLYDDWVAYITAKYTAVQDRVEAAGEVEGAELTTSPGGWDYSDPDDRDDWLKKKTRDREDEREATGTWALEPRYSEDGRYYAANITGRLHVTEMPEYAWYPFSGEYLNDPELSQRRREMSNNYPTEFAHGFDFVPGQDAMVITGHEGMVTSNFDEITGLAPELDGYTDNFKELWYIKLHVYEDKEKGRTFETLTPPEKAGTRLYEKGTVFPIPNTKRGMDPAISPDGKRIAYFEYGDGTMNLVTINFDGTDKKYLTDFHDGTWLQRVDWSPDGKQLVAAIFRNYQQDLFIIDAESGAMKPITWDSHESFDAHWGWDGRIYFSSDPDGIFNLFSYDPNSGEIRQLTNVIGGAQQPWLTPEGNLLYVNFTAHGFKIYGLSKDEFYDRPATDRFTTDYDEELVQASLEYSEDFSMYAEATKPYRWVRNIMPPTAVPMFRYSNNSMVNWGIEGGFQVYAQDFVEKNVGLFQVLLGEDLDVLAQYFNQTWYPNIMVYLRHIETKFDFAYALDADGDFATDDDRSIFEGKNAQVANIAAAGVFYPWNARTTTGIFAQVVGFGFKTTADSGYEPFMVSANASAFVTYQTISDRYRFSANPPPGHVVNVSYLHGYSDIVYDDYYGVDVDDGMKLDAYQFNQYDFSWTGHFQVKPIGGFDPLGLLGLASAHSHRFQLAFQGGFVDRNVQFNDEYRAGGRHPYFWGNNALNPNTMFAGYPAASLSGETMLILSAAYRFPVITKINKKIGPMYLYDVHAQIMGTAGNLWSYRPPDEPGTYYTNRYDARVARNPDDVYREVPFKDYAYKNSPVDPVTGEVTENRILTDIGAEIRVSSTLWRGYWNSFVRVAYGFNEIRGVGDVNGDDVIDTADSTLGDSLSNETEAPGIRVYVGLGTGW